jgi:hypothetical protein
LTCWHAGPPQFAILGANRAKKLPEKKIQPPPPYAKGSRPCGSTKFSAEMLNRSLMAAPPCARARRAGANALAGSSITRNHRAFPLLIEWVPGKIHGPVIACPAKAASQTAQHLLNLTLKSEDSPPLHLPFCCPSCLFGNGREKCRPESRVWQASLRKLPPDSPRSCVTSSRHNTTSTGTAPRSKTARSVSPRFGEQGVSPDLLFDGDEAS